MRILAVLFCLVAFNAYPQEQQFSEMLSIKNVKATSLEEVFTEPSFPAAAENSKAARLAAPEAAAAFQSKSLYFETYVVYIQSYGGYTFHVADYLDGTRVVTCLDGPLMGLQGISVNGIKIGESNDVIYYPTFFVHFYPGGKIYSYLNKQIFEIY